METYKNLSGKSGVEAFEIGKDYIKVWFSENETPYTYNYVKPGSDDVEKMKLLAVAGIGLSTYISQFVGKNYYKEG